MEIKLIYVTFNTISKVITQEGFISFWFKNIFYYDIIINSHGIMKMVTIIRVSVCPLHVEMSLLLCPLEALGKKNYKVKLSTLRTPSWSPFRRLFRVPGAVTHFRLPQLLRQTGNSRRHNSLPPFPLAWPHWWFHRPLTAEYTSPPALSHHIFRFSHTPLPQELDRICGSCLASTEGGLQF